MDLSSHFVNPSIELAVLSAISSRPKEYFQVADYLSPDLFSLENRKVFETITKAISEQKAPPEVQNTPSRDLERDARHLADLYKKRLIASELSSILPQLTTGPSAEKILESLEKSISKINHAIVEQRTGQLYSATQCLPDLLATIQEAYKRRQKRDAGPKGIPTGLKLLDYHLSGLQKGIHLLSAEPGKGKSTFALNIAINAARRGFQSLFLSFEESLENLVQKSVCSQTRTDLKKLSDGHISPEKFSNDISGMTYLENLYFLEGSPKTSIAQVKAKALQIMNNHKTDRIVVIVDYLQKWASMIPSSRDYRLIVSQLSGELRDLSKRLNSPLLAIVSQNRTERGQAKMSSMKESGDLEYDADSIWIITDDEANPAKEPARSLELNIIKNRFGSQDKVGLLFEPQFGLFSQKGRC